MTREARLTELKEDITEFTKLLEIAERPNVQ